MASCQALSPQKGAFTKYAELPKDIRLMIIDEVTQVAHQEYRWNNWSWEPFLFKLSSINREWNRATEMILYDAIHIHPEDLSDFAKICGTCHGRLNTVTFSIRGSDGPRGCKREKFFGDAIRQLFNIMKDWIPVDRERNSLIEVRLDLLSSWSTHPSDLNICSNLGTLPKVPIIGALHEELSGWGVLHPLSSL